MTYVVTRAGKLHNTLNIDSSVIHPAVYITVKFIIEKTLFFFVVHDSVHCKIPMELSPFAGSVPFPNCLIKTLSDYASQEVGTLGAVWALGRRCERVAAEGAGREEAEISEEQARRRGH